LPFCVCIYMHAWQCRVPVHMHVITILPKCLFCSSSTLWVAPTLIMLSPYSSCLFLGATNAFNEPKEPAKVISCVSYSASWYLMQLRLVQTPHLNCSIPQLIIGIVVMFLESLIILLVCSYSNILVVWSFVHTTSCEIIMTLGFHCQHYAHTHHFLFFLKNLVQDVVILILNMCSCLSFKF